MVDAIDRLKDEPGVHVVYDGDCPFCASYVRLVRLREAAGTVKLLDARIHPELVAAARKRGLDMNEGMIVLYGGELYYADRAMRLLSVLTSRVGFLNRALAAFFASDTRSTITYPFLRTGRRMALRLLGKQQIPNG